MKLIEGVNARYCRKCGELKAFTEFYKKKTGKYGYHQNCKKCIAEEKLSKGITKGRKKSNDELFLNKKFGYLTVLQFGYKKGTNDYWLCKCDCGKEIYVCKFNLINGKTKSCGCKSEELRKQNSDEFSGTRISLLKSKTRKDNKTGVKGVGFNKKTNKWRAGITIQGKNKFLGCFDNIEDAIKARKEAEEKYFKPIIEKYERENV